jgi:hypothetical protein
LHNIPFRQPNDANRIRRHGEPALEDFQTTFAGKEYAMNRAIALLTGAGLGAGMSYFLDPRLGRRRRALIRDKMVRFSHDLQEVGDAVRRDAGNRMRGLAAGDLTVLVGGKNALRGNPLRGDWSPTGRALLGVIGGGLFLSGLMRDAPMACVLGTAGLALMIEGATNAGIEDITHLPSKMSNMAAENFDHTEQKMKRPKRKAATA